jgi:CubicO group peptidase (beta-lactamase class C family)
MTPDQVHGHTDPRFAAVADAFRANWTESHELGAAVCVYQDGRPVVDLWAGVADIRTGRAWEEHTPGLTFSVGKGLSALLVHLLAARGVLDLDAPIERYWPEFAGAGKAGMPVMWALTHRTAVAYLDGSFTLAEVCEGSAVLRAIESQTPNWTPGTAYAYHAVTQGFVLGEIVRRATGRTFAEVFRESIAEPLGLHSWFGVPDSVLAEVAVLDVGPLEWSDPEAIRAVDAAMAADDRAWRALTLNGAIRLPMGSRRDLDYNEEIVLRAQLPASGLVTTAHSLARVYSSTVAETDGIRLLDDEHIRRAAQLTIAGDHLFSFGTPQVEERWGEGLRLPPVAAGSLLGPTSFGHSGAGGAIGFADIDARVGFGYVTNRMSIGADDRARRLVTAVAAALEPATR